MTRDNLIKAIYDNTEDWSCKTPCHNAMEEEEPQKVCMECAERLLDEYENQIRADVIEEFVSKCKEKIEEICLEREDDITFLDIFDIEKIAEQLKEQK